MKRRGFFARVTGALAGFFGISALPCFASSSVETQGEKPYIGRMAFYGISNLDPKPEHELADVSRRFAWYLGYETAVLLQHLNRTACAFTMRIHPRNLESHNLYCGTYGRSVTGVRTINDYTIEIDVAAEMNPGHCTAILKSRNGSWDGLAKLGLNY